MKQNYTPGSISFAAGFLGPRGNPDAPFMLVDSEKANGILTEILSSGKDVDYAELGLDGDWSENSVIIYEDGEWQETAVRDPDLPVGKGGEYDIFHGSSWATPTLIVYFNDGPSLAFECWKKEEAA